MKPKHKFDAMAATEKAARSQYEMAKNGARQEDKAAAAAQVNVPKEQLPRYLPTWMRPSSQLLPTVK